MTDNIMLKRSGGGGTLDVDIILTLNGEVLTLDGNVLILQ